jgi:hypothetical protein
MTDNPLSNQKPTLKLLHHFFYYNFIFTNTPSTADRKEIIIRIGQQSAHVHFISVKEAEKNPRIGYQPSFLIKKNHRTFTIIQ